MCCSLDDIKLTQIIYDLTIYIYYSKVSQAELAQTTNYKVQTTDFVEQHNLEKVCSL